MTMRRPLAIDLFTGLHGWAEGCIAEGFEVIGFDLVDMSAEIGEPKPKHFRLVIQDVLTLHGSQFRDAALIVASPPCQKYSYMAMPFSRGKAKAAAIRADTTGAALVELNRLFDACFRIQREASEAAGRRIPLVVENVRGAEPWVGRAKWNFGSYYLWGDVPALMPQTLRAQKFNPDGTGHGQGSWFAIADSQDRGARKNPGFRFDGSGRSFQSESVQRHVADIGGPRRHAEGIKQGGTWFHDNKSASRMHSSKSPARKAASAKIAKIPFALSSWIARCYYPQPARALLHATAESTR